jgi:hypothetical protein
MTDQMMKGTRPKEINEYLQPPGFVAHPESARATAMCGKTPLKSGEKPFSRSNLVD